MNKYIISFIIGAIVLAGGGAGATWYTYKLRADQFSKGGPGFYARSGVEQEGSSSTDMSDDRQLLGIAHYFFVGKVISQGEPRKLDIFTSYPYKVAVILNIKGVLHGDIDVDGHGLQPGSTYLMGAQWNANGWKLITV